jgi:UDPglucose 6-dehydrogenase
MRVAIIGAGHVGLPTAAALAHLGHEVSLTDADPEKLASLRAGRVPFHEPGLPELVREGMEAGRLSLASEVQVAGARMALICVGTPPRASGEANLAAVEHSAEVVARHATGPMVLVEKSTVPTGTAERIGQLVRRIRPELRFSMVSNPEFLREGSAVEDALRPDRILVGSDEPEGLEAMRELYAPLIDGGTRWIETDLRTAELAKHASNAFLALKISYANALARICERAGADVVAVADVMGTDPRIGRAFLNAGLGYGGSCFPKDLVAFERVAAQLGYGFPLLGEVARINGEAVEAVYRMVEDAVWNLEGKRVALLGLAFKPGTDDVRFAPALELARLLLRSGAAVVGHDPAAGASAKAEVPGLEVAADPYGALDGAHCAVLCTEWPELLQLDPGRAAAAMAAPVLVDGRNALDPEPLVAAGFTYLPVGRPPARPVG